MARTVSETHGFKMIAPGVYSLWRLERNVMEASPLLSMIADLEIDFTRPNTFYKMAKVRITHIHRCKYIFRVGSFILTLPLGNRVIIWASEATHEGQTQKN